MLEKNHFTDDGYAPFQRFGIAAVLLLGFCRAWIGRFSLDADGLSYLDLSDAFRRHDWPGFLNSYWSPLYPALLAIGRMILPSSKRGELIAVHVVNFLIFVAALAAFEFFYRELRASIILSLSWAEGFTGLPEWSLWSVAHLLFLWASLDLITIWTVCPDMLVSAFAYAIAGFLLRFRRDPSWQHAVALGILLGVSYSAKAAMFLLAFISIAIALGCARSLKNAFKRGLLMVLTFAILAGPLVTALSRQKHRFTFGDSGRINYAMFVNPGGATRNWQGEPQFGIVAAHPTRKLPTHPPVYEFAEPVGGTFPPWYDPSYWEEGRAPRFSLSAQVRILIVHAFAYADLLLVKQNCLLAAAIVLLLLARRKALTVFRDAWPLLMMCGAALALYMLVHVETRFIGGYVAILWLAFFSSIRVPVPQGLFSGYLLLAVSLTLLISVLGATARAVREDGPYSALTEVALSDRLDSLGLHPGDHIAIVGGGGMYAARLSGLKIVAEVMGEDTPAFWRLTPGDREVLVQKMAVLGVRAVLAPDPGPALQIDSSWRRVEALPFYLHSI